MNSTKNFPKVGWVALSSDLDGQTLSLNAYFWIISSYQLLAEAAFMQMIIYIDLSVERGCF